MQCLETIPDNADLIKSKDSFDLNSVIKKLVGIHNEMVTVDTRHRQEKTKLVFKYLCSIASKTHLKIAEQLVKIISVFFFFSRYNNVQILCLNYFQS